MRYIAPRCWGAFSRCQIHFIHTDGNCKGETDVGVRTCVKQIRNTQRIRSLRSVGHGGASGGEGVLPGCSSLAVLVPSLGLDSVESLKTKSVISSAHLSLSPSHHSRCSFTAVVLLVEESFTNTMKSAGWVVQSSSFCALATLQQNRKGTCLQAVGL